MYTENDNDLNGLKTRLEAADVRNGDLLRALNDTLGKLSIIPNGKHHGPALCIMWTEIQKDLGSFYNFPNTAAAGFLTYELFLWESEPHLTIWLCYPLLPLVGMHRNML